MNEMKKLKLNKRVICRLFVSREKSSEELKSEGTECYCTQNAHCN